MSSKLSLIQVFDDTYKNYRLNYLFNKGEIKTKNYQELALEDKARLVSKKYEEEVVLFVKRMAEMKPGFDFRALERNINTLKIKCKRHDSHNYADYYLWLDNRIFLLKYCGFISIYHELMRMASYYLTKDLISMSGFQQSNNLTTSIGLGLNEGYTQLLTERYFYDQDVLESYQILVPYAKMAEMVVGKDLMEELYFNADLYGLQEEFAKDTAREDFVKFIDDLDYINLNLKGSNTQEFKEHFQRAWSFLYLVYCKKQNRLLENDEISLGEYYKRLDRIIERIDTRYTAINDVMFWDCDKDYMILELAKIGIDVTFNYTNSPLEEKEAFEKSKLNRF